MTRLFLAVGLLLGLTAPAMAATMSATAPAASSAVAAPTDPSQGLEISPPLIETSINPGQSAVLNIRIRNVSSGTLEITGKTDDFGAKGEDGTPQILLDETQSTRYSFKYWVGAIPKLTLQPQEAQVVKITVNVPANAEPGGHYGVVRFSGVAPGVNGSGVALSASIGTLVLMKVNGAITEHLSPVDMSVTDADGKKPFLFEHGPLGLTLRIKNDGNVHENPVGSIVVSNLFGGTTAKIAFNDSKRNILPDSIRKFQETINKKALFGRYTVKANLTYAGNKTLVMTPISFWVIPWKQLLAVIIILIALFFLLRWGMKRYNQYIINQARR